MNTIREFGKEKIIEVLNAMTNTDNTEKNKDKENKEEKRSDDESSIQIYSFAKKENKKFNLKKLKKMGKIIEKLREKYQIDAEQTALIDAIEVEFENSISERTSSIESLFNDF